MHNKTVKFYLCQKKRETLVAPKKKRNYWRKKRNFFIKLTYNIIEYQHKDFKTSAIY